MSILEKAIKGQKEKQDLNSGCNTPLSLLASEARSATVIPGAGC